MIFETLNESNERGELMLVDGGMCHWHLRRDGQITIREIIVEKYQQRIGIGSWMIRQLAENVLHATSIFAKCPVDLPANDFYRALGFQNEGEEVTKSGRRLYHWRLPLSTKRQQEAPASPD